MGLAERVLTGMRERRAPQGAWPTGSHTLEWEQEHGHRDEFGPAEYGNYIATSNDIYSIVTFRARLIGSLKLRAYIGDDQDKEEKTDGQIVSLLKAVNPFWTFSRLMRMTETCMGLWGEAMWVANRGANGMGQPRELWWVKPDRMHPIPHPSGYLDGFLYEPLDGSEPIPFRNSEVIWFRYPNPLDEFAGLSPLAAARLAADTSSSMMTSNRKLFTNGLQVGGILHPKGDKVSFTKEQAQELEESIERRLKGADKSHRWTVLRYEAGISQPVSPKDAEFLGGLNLTFRQACRAYGVPSPLLNDMEHATLANVRSFQQALWEHALVPDAKFYADELVEQFLSMFRVGRGAAAEPDHLEFDFSQVPALQESASAVWDRERQAIEVGGLKINEWRKSKGLPPVEWGDVWWAPVNKGPVTDGDDLPGRKAGPATPRELAEIIQKLYLGVDVVVTAEEARELLRIAGADLADDAAFGGNGELDAEARAALASRLIASDEARATAEEIARVEAGLAVDASAQNLLDEVRQMFDQVGEQLGQFSINGHGRH